MIRKVKSLLLMCMAVMALFAVTLFGCTDNDDKKDGGEVSVVSIALNEDALTLTVGQTATLEVTVLPGNATDKSVSWSTSAAAVATVSDGVVNAVAAGQAVITVTSAADSSITASCTVTVTAAVSHTHTFDKQVAEDEYLASAATCTEFAYGEPAGHSYGEWQIPEDIGDLIYSGQSVTLTRTCTVCQEGTDGRVQTLVMSEVIDEKENPDANFILDSSKEWGMLVDFVRTGTYETTPYNGYFVTEYIMPDCTRDGMISGIYKSEEFGDIAFENISMSQLEHNGR